MRVLYIVLYVAEIMPRRGWVEQRGSAGFWPQSAIHGIELKEFEAADEYWSIHLGLVWSEKAVLSATQGGVRGNGAGLTYNFKLG
jgi:hypothetical protein